MAIRPDWNIGKINLVAGSAEFTTVNAMLNMSAVEPGDVIITPSGHILVIKEITGANSGTLMLPCPAGAAGTELPLRIRFQPDGSRLAGALRSASALLSGGNVEALAGLVGQDGQSPIFTGAGTMGLASFVRYDVDQSLNASQQSQARANINAISNYRDLGVIPNVNLPNRLQALQGGAVSDLNSVKESGWCYVNPNTLNFPPTTVVGMVLSLFQVETHGTQIFFDRQTGTQSFRRVCNNNVWTPWMPLSAGDYTQSLGETGWCRLPNGMYLQWGRPVVQISNTNAGTIILPTTFPNNNFTSVLANGDWGVTAARSAVLVNVGRARSSIDFAVYGIQSPLTMRVNFMVVGN